MTKLNETREALTRAVLETFADMAFMEVIPEDDRKDDFDVGQLVTIEFAKPINGQMLLYMPIDTKQKIAEYIYGVEWDNISSNQVDDCLLELLNVLAGNFLKNLGVSEEKHSISLPQLLYDDSEIDLPDERETQFFNAEDHPFNVSVWYRQMNT